VGNTDRARWTHSAETLVSVWRSAGNQPGGAEIGKVSCLKLTYTIYGARLNSAKANLAGAWLKAFLKRNRRRRLIVNKA